MLGLTKAWYRNYNGTVVPFNSGGGGIEFNNWRSITSEETDVSLSKYIIIMVYNNNGDGTLLVDLNNKLAIGGGYTSHYGNETPARINSWWVLYHLSRLEYVACGSGTNNYILYLSTMKLIAYGGAYFNCPALIQ